MKRVHSDGAKEFLCMKDNLTANGIDFSSSPRYSPGSNGAVDRFNRSVLSKDRAIMIQSKLLFQFWGEAILQAVHVHNSITCKPLKGSSPYEPLSEKSVIYLI